MTATYRLTRMPRWLSDVMSSGVLVKHQVRCEIDFGGVLHEDLICDVPLFDRETRLDRLGRYLLTDGRAVLLDDMTDHDWELTIVDVTAVDKEVRAREILHDNAQRMYAQFIRMGRVGDKRSNRRFRPLETEDVRNVALGQEVGVNIDPLDYEQNIALGRINRKITRLDVPLAIREAFDSGGLRR